MPDQTQPMPKAIARPPKPPTMPTDIPPAPGVFGAVLLAALVGAVALPAWRVGVGWPVALVAVASAILVARSARRTADGGGSGPVASGMRR